MLTALGQVFNGHKSTYLTIAEREKERLAISISYELHAENHVGFFAVRFVLSREDNNIAPLQTFTARELGKFKTQDDVEFQAIRLDKIGIPIFSPGPTSFTALQMLDKFMVWDVTADWVVERCKENGFSTFITFSDENTLPIMIRNLVTGKYGVQDENYQLVLQFPKLKKEMQHES